MMKIIKSRLLLINIAGFFLSILLLILQLREGKNFFTFDILANLLIMVVFMYLVNYQKNANRIVDRIKEEAKRIIKGNYNAKIMVKNNEIFGDICDIINQLSNLLLENEVQQKYSEESRKRLLSNISHDLRTPLTSIIGYMDALRDGVAASEEERMEYLDIVLYKARNLKELMDEIFYMSKLDSDEISMDFKVEDLGEIIRECIIEFLPEINRNKIKLSIHIPDEKLPIYSDRLSIVRIVNNLIKNSITYGKEGKMLGISIKETERDYVVSVWDKGPGISQDDLPYIFERLYIGDKSRNSRLRSSGLGLTIVKKLIEKHEGKIWVKSIPYEKTEFTFTLPKL